MDPDQFVIIERLESYIKDTHNATYQQPVNFGNTVCNNEAVCYTEGGLYGISRSGLKHWVKYRDKHPKAYDDVPNEDFFSSYIFCKVRRFPLHSSCKITLTLKFDFFSSHTL